ncbi:MAG: flagellar biosynthetic protein FliR [Planctomycetes bacterium]|nr:flagellar biosynthetic protein FliR [Planctomycetota bacterium]
MVLELGEYAVWVPTLMLVIFRVAGIFITAPMLGSPTIPPVVKGMIAVVVGLAVTARLAAPAAMPSTWTALVMAVGREMLVGATLGYAASLLFVGVTVAGHNVSQQMGIGLAEVFNPQLDDATDLVSTTLNMLALVIYLSIGGHRLLVEGLMGTFTTVPLMGFSAGADVLEIMLALLTAAFILGIKVAAPVLVTMMLASVAMGLIQRTMPQLNILSAGFQIRVLASLTILAVSLAALVPLIEIGWSITVTAMGRLFP